MKGLEFLSNVKLAANEAVKPAIARTSTAKARNPETADIRVYKDGAVYPSAALVTEFDLQYRKKDVEPKGNGFDVFKSTDYLNTKAWPAENRIIFIAAVSKTEGKLDLFGRTTYDKDSGDASDVNTQGATTFGVNLLEYVKEVYGIEPTEEIPYIDLIIARETPFNTEDGIYYLPKVVSRGEEKGKTTMERREGITLFPLVPAAWAEDTGTEPASGEEEGGTIIDESPVVDAAATPATPKKATAAV